MTDGNAPLFESLTTQVELVRSKRISSTGLTKLYIDRIRRLNSDLNIVIRENFANAIEKAETLDRQFADTGIPKGPLHGIPFTLKDAFRIKGIATSFGIPGFNLLPSFDNCTLVERLESAGAILLGQTNVPLSCFDWQSNSPIYGLTRNPLDREKTVGGSSGGSAGSVAAYFSPFEVGSDVAGSIRYPAHCCGVFGLRPTHDFVPFADIGPILHKKSFSNLAVAGPLARSIDDLELVLRVLANAEGVAVSKEKLKIGFTLGWSGLEVDKKSLEQIKVFMQKVRNQGHELIPIDPPLGFEECTKVWGIILGYEYKQMIPGPFKIRPVVELFNHFFNIRRLGKSSFPLSFQEGLLATRERYMSSLIAAEKLRLEFFEKLKPFDLWLTPTSVGGAIRHQKTGAPISLDGKLTSYTSYLGNFLTGTTLMHHPVLVAPIGASTEFPIGVQLHGKPNQDWQLLADCKSLESTFRVPGRIEL